MEGGSAKGVLSCLGLLETQSISKKTEPQQRSRVKALKAKVEELKKQRDRLSAETRVHESLQKLRTSMDNNEEDVEMDDGSKNSQLLQLMAKHTQLKDLLLAHHVLGGYDVVKTNKDKALCFSLATAYQGTYLCTYCIEIDVKQTLRIIRHNFPPFISVNNLAEETNMQQDIRGFLDTLSLHLNGFAGRKQQLQLVKEMHKSVEVLESNALCSLLVLMLTVPKTKTSVLCSLDYSDHTRCLPTRVNIQSEEEDLSDTPQWQKNRSLLMDTPVHKALQEMKTLEHIV